MKKILSVLFTLLLIASVMIPQTAVFAEAEEFDDSFDKETAKQIISEFIDIRNSIGMFFGWFAGGNTTAYIRNPPTSDKLESIPEGGEPWNWYVRVKEGYSPDEVKERIRALFDDSLAETVIDASESFYDKYYLENGVWYWNYYPVLDECSYEDGDRTNTYFELTELDEIKTRLEPDDKTAYISVPVHRYYDKNDGNLEESRLNTNVTFKVQLKDGIWKICYLDFSNMLFRAENGKNKGETLTEEAVRETLIALVSDIYFPLFVGSECRIDTYSPAPNSRNHLYKMINNRTYSILEGNLSDSKTWFDYAANFCSEEVAEYLIVFSNMIKHFGNKLWFHCQPAEDYTLSRKDYMYSYSIKNALSDSITITQISDKKAMAKCSLTWYYNSSPKVEISLEFEKTEGGWKVVNTDFIDKLDAKEFLEDYHRTPAYPDRPKAPSTGNESVFMVVAAATLALAVVVRKRKAAGKRLRQMM